MATYTELSTTLSLEDAYKIDEALTIKNYHSWLATKDTNRK